MAFFEQRGPALDAIPISVMRYSDRYGSILCPKQGQMQPGPDHFVNKVRVSKPLSRAGIEIASETVLHHALEQSSGDIKWQRIMMIY